MSCSEKYLRVVGYCLQGKHFAIDTTENMMKIDNNHKKCMILIVCNGQC